jgi:tyrosyl-DNA phosphodiesterase-1
MSALLCPLVELWRLPLTSQKSQISLLILNSFVVDDNWLSTILPDPLSVPQIIIRPHPKAEPTWNGKVQAQPSGEVWCYPRMNGDFG